MKKYAGLDLSKEIEKSNDLANFYLNKSLKDLNKAYILIVVSAVLTAINLLIIYFN